MASVQVDPPKAAEGAPAQELPSRPAKQPKEKAAKGGKKESLEVCIPSLGRAPVSKSGAPSHDD